MLLYPNSYARYEFCVNLFFGDKKRQILLVKLRFF